MYCVGVVCLFFLCFFFFFNDTATTEIYTLSLHDALPISTRNIFGWQKPCYLLGEGYAKTFTELMETTDWDSYGTGRYEKCANCMAHCGYEPTAAQAAIRNPLATILTAIRGVRTEGPMAPEISLARQ